MQQGLLTRIFLAWRPETTQRTDRNGQQAQLWNRCWGVQWRPAVGKCICLRGPVVFGSQDVSGVFSDVKLHAARARFVWGPEFGVAHCWGDLAFKFWKDSLSRNAGRTLWRSSLRFLGSSGDCKTNSWRSPTSDVSQTLSCNIDQASSALQGIDLSRALSRSTHRLGGTWWEQPWMFFPPCDEGSELHPVGKPMPGTVPHRRWNRWFQSVACEGL